MKILALAMALVLLSGFAASSATTHTRRDAPTTTVETYSDVVSQIPIVVPAPKVDPTERARHIVANRASSKLGNHYKVGWCQAWVRKLLHKKGIGDFDHDGAPDAEDGWKAAKKHHKAFRIHSIYDIPRGALVYWTGGSNDNGHVAVSAGNGKIYSTDLPRYGKIGKVSIKAPHKKWHVRLVGYVIIEPR